MDFFDPHNEKKDSNALITITDIFKWIENFK